MAILLNEIEKRFSRYEPEDADAIERLEVVREGAKLYAELLITQCLEGRELSLAITNIEQALMWASAAILRDQE